MTDKEFIIYLCEQIWGIEVDGKEPDLEFIKEELNKRDIDPEEIFVF